MSKVSKIKILPVPLKSGIQKYSIFGTGIQMNPYKICGADEEIVAYNSDDNYAFRKEMGYSKSPKFLRTPRKFYVFRSNLR